MLQKRWQKKSVFIFFSVWSVAMLVLGGALTAVHSPTDPAHEVAPAFRAQPTQARPSQPTDEWHITHFLDPLHCGCSKSVENHLLKRGILPGIARETIVYIEGSQVGRGALEKAGFATRVVAPGQEEVLFGVKSVPLMEIKRNGNERLYFGGYYTTMAQTQNKDVEIIGDTLKGSYWQPLPSFGCARSKTLQRAKDPLGLKYPNAP